MKVAVHPFSNEFCNDELFNPNSQYNRDNTLYPYIYLKEHLNLLGIEIHTCNIGDIRTYDKLIMLNYTKQFDEITGIFFKKEDKVLFIYEPSVTLPGMWSSQALYDFSQAFGRVYTYAENLVDSVGFHKFNYPQVMPDDRVLADNFSSERKYLMAFIGSDYQSDYPGELYTFRRQVVKYFCGQFEDFHVYGGPWDCRCYIGHCGEKQAIYRNYRFALCIENCAMQGYITEKIFDAFMAGCIPVYFGAPNVCLHIPPETFIDMRRSNSMEMLSEFLLGMDDATAAAYRQNILNFLKSAGYYPFSTDCFVKTIADSIGVK